MSFYEYNDNTLLHGIGFDLAKFDSICKHGLLSKKDADNLGVDMARVFSAYNGDDAISMVRHSYVNKYDKNSAYYKFIKKGISFIVETDDFIFDVNDRVINSVDEVLVEGSISCDSFTGILLPEEYADSSLNELPMFNMKSNHYKNINDTCNNLIKFVASLGYKLSDEEKAIYKSLSYSLLSSLEATKKDKELSLEEKELIREDKLALAEFMSSLVHRVFCMRLDSDFVTLYDAVDYLNSNNLNLDIYVGGVLKNKRKR